MYFSQVRYLRTPTGRVFKLDGTIPILELRGRIWTRPQPFSDEFFSVAQEISQEEANSGVIFTDEGIETDNVSSYLCFFEALNHLTVFKYTLFLNDLDLFQTPLGGFNEQKLYLTLIDCCMATFLAFYYTGIFHEKFSNLEKKTTDLVFVNTLLTLTTKLLPNVHETPESTIDLANGVMDEFTFAIRDKERVEQVFLPSLTPEIVQNYNSFYHCYACLVNRFYLRYNDIPEGELPFSKQAHLLIMDPEEAVHFTALLSQTVNSFVKTDSKAFDMIMEDKLDVFQEKVNVA